MTCIAACIDNVVAWMRSNRLKLNPAKTEILRSATSSRLHQLPQSPLCISTDYILPASVVRDLGIYIDSDVSMRTRVTRTVSAGFFAMLHQLRSIRRSVLRPVLQSLVLSLVLSRLDFGNSTLVSIPAHFLQRLQCVMSAAARMIFP